MPSIQRQQTLATTVNEPNLFAGSAFEYPERNAIVSLACVASATGGFITVQAGGEVVMEESPPIVRDAFPIIPDDYTLNFAIAQGRRLIVAARNPTAGNLTFRAVAQLTYV